MKVLHQLIAGGRPSGSLRTCEQRRLHGDTIERDPVHKNIRGASFIRLNPQRNSGK
jgi:hypothetical protein